MMAMRQLRSTMLMENLQYNTCESLPQLYRTHHNLMRM